MAPKNTKKEGNKGGKGNNSVKLPGQKNKTNKAGQGGKVNKHGKGGRVGVRTLIIPTPITPRPDILLPPIPQTINLMPVAQKWCLKNNVPVLDPVIERWYFLKDNTKVSLPAESFDSLKKHTVVNFLHHSHVIRGDADVPSSSYLAITYEETLYNVIDKKTGKKDWVTTRVTGWVDDACLDDYIEEFPKFEVEIPHATRKSTDLEQDMTIEDEGYDEILARYNMCGELCIAYIVKKDIDKKSSIDTVLAKWKTEGKNKSYERLVGKGRDKTLNSRDLKEMLDLYNTGVVNKKIEPYVVELKKIPLAVNAFDECHASDDLQKKLLEYYFITLVTINPNTGELIPNTDPAKRNHWVVVDKVTRNGARVELYNPSPNKRQAYSFREFYKSVGSNPNTGWWVERKRRLKTEKFIRPVFEVAIDSPTPETTDAEQYMKIDGARKTKLCGEFCITFILTRSLDVSLSGWMDAQKRLKKLGKPTAGIWELATLMHAYGLNNSKDDVTSDNPEGTRIFSIDKVLKYWKSVQTDLYNSILGNGNNEPTGMDDLITILKAYGYNNKGDYIYGSMTSSPERDANMLKTHYFVAGVTISTQKNGALKNRLGGGVEHWVVVEKITPVGNLIGGNGGWVKLYNPYPNVVEEYSYKEFMESFSGSGLWVKKEINPTFTWQFRAPAKDKRKISKAIGNAAANKMSKGDLLREIKAGIGTPLMSLARKLSNRSGWSKKDIVKLMKTPETSNRKSMAEIEREICSRLGVDFIPRQIGRWLYEKSGGDLSFAAELAYALRESGILVVEGREAKLVDVESPTRSTLLQTVIASRIDSSAKFSQLAGRVARTFTDQVLEQLKEIPPTIQAYKSMDEYLKWEKTIALPESNIYRVRKWGEGVMGDFGFDVDTVGTSNFQAVGLYNEETGFGAVTNFIHILRDDIDQLIDMQFDEIVDGKKKTVEDKMNWLCQPRGRIYMFDSRRDSWQKSSQIRWGTIALGGNLVQVVGRKDMNVKLPGEKNGKLRPMARLAGFRKSDWSRPLDELLAEGLVHRCFVANSGNTFADTSRGIVYSPFYSLLDWNFGGTKKPDALWIPFEYLEDKPKPKKL